MSPRTVLHVLPHPGGGGETYVDALARMNDWRHERVFLAAGREPSKAVLRLASTVPRVNLRARRFDVLHVHGEIASLLCLPALARQPSVVTLHGLNLVRRTSGTIGQVAASNLRLIVRAATRTICVSAAERDEVLEVVGARQAGRLVVVLNGVEAAPLASSQERDTIRSELGIDARVVAVSVGVLEPPKDPMSVARAAISVAESGVPIVVMFVGDGRLRRELEAVADRSDGVVRVLGQRSDVRRVLVAADIFVLSSRHEGLPYALLEAMSAGLPSVVSGYPGAAEVVGAGGILVTPGDVEGFARALGGLATDQGERAELGERARERVESCFSLERMIERTEQVYADVLRVPRQPTR